VCHGGTLKYLYLILLALLTGVATLVTAQEEPPLKFDAATLQAFVNDWKLVQTEDPLLKTEAQNRIKFTPKEIPALLGGTEKVYWIDYPAASNLEFRLEVSLARTFHPDLKPKHPELGDIEKYDLVAGTTFIWSTSKTSFFTVPVDKAKGNWGVYIRILARETAKGPSAPWHRTELGLPFASAGSGLLADTSALRRLLALEGFSYTLEL
jgi:hypothetical protein